MARLQNRPTVLAYAAFGYRLGILLHRGWALAIGADSPLALLLLLFMAFL
jgi:hypothetical protein